MIPKTELEIELFAKLQVAKDEIQRLDEILATQYDSIQLVKSCLSTRRSVTGKLLATSTKQSRKEVWEEVCREDDWVLNILEENGL